MEEIQPLIDTLNLDYVLNEKCPPWAKIIVKWKASDLLRRWGIHKVVGKFPCLHMESENEIKKNPSHSSNFIILLQPFSPGLSSNPAAREVWGVILSETPLTILWALLGLLWRSSVGKLAASLGSSYGKYISQHSWQTNLFEGDSQEAWDWPSNNEFSILHSPQPIIFFLPCSYLLLFNIYASYKCAQHWTIYHRESQCNNNIFSQIIEKDP